MFFLDFPIFLMVILLLGAETNPKNQISLKSVQPFVSYKWCNTHDLRLSFICIDSRGIILVYLFILAELGSEVLEFPATCVFHEFRIQNYKHNQVYIILSTSMRALVFLCTYLHSFLFSDSLFKFFCLVLSTWQMERGDSIPHLQRLSNNNSYPKPNKPNSSY